MGEWTNIHCGIWEWEPFVKHKPRERNLWLALYTSGTSKRICPGLWHGPVVQMAHAAKLNADDTYEALEKLIESEMVVFDFTLCVLRMTKLPDAGDRPTSWKALKGMWSGFKTVPQCNVRDCHVTLVRWLVDQGKPSEEMETVWGETFGKIPHAIPLPSIRLTDCDTSTSHQPGLFARSVVAASAMTFDSVSIHPGSDQDPEREQDQVQDQVQDQDPDAPTGKVILFVRPEPADPEAARKELRGRIMREIGPAHAKAYMAIRGEFEIPVVGMSVVGHFTELGEYLDSLPSLDEALESCRRLLALREHEARITKSLGNFGRTMWWPALVAWAESKTIADIDRMNAGGSKQSGTIGRFEPVAGADFGPTGDLPL